METQNLDSTDLNLPITTRKGVRNCTKHPIAKYLSYQKISETHKAFLTNISSISLPRTIQEAFSTQDWRLAVQEEMDALKKVELGKLLICRETRLLLGTNGSLP